MRDGKPKWGWKRISGETGVESWNAKMGMEKSMRRDRGGELPLPKHCTAQDGSLSFPAFHRRDSLSRTKAVQLRGGHGLRPKSDLGPMLLP